MAHRCLNKHGYILKKSQITNHEIKEFKKDLTFLPIVMEAFKPLARPKKFFGYLESKDRYFLPRYYALEKYGEPRFNKLNQGITPVDFDMYWGLLDHQHNSWNAIQKQFVEKKSGGILCLPCGMGKTSLAIRTAAFLKVKTIVLVNKEFLMNQWVDVIHECTNARVGIIQGSKVDVKDKDIVIAMLQSVSMKEYPKEVFADFGLAIVDECHHIASETFSKALPKIACKYTLGLSATPIRKDGLTQVFLNYMGPIFHKEKRKGSNQVWIKFLNIFSDTEHFKLEILKATGTKNTGQMTTNVSKYEVGNYFVLELCRLLIKKKPRKVLVLGARREQLEWLNENWSEMGYKNCQNRPATCGLYYGAQGSNKKLHRQMLKETEKCDIVWGTNDVAQEGLDIKDLNTLVLLAGGTDVEQASGRILRKHHKDVAPTVIDLTYQFGNFAKHSKLRRNYYHDEGYVMHAHDITLDDNLEHMVGQLDKLEVFLEDYPAKGAKGTMIVRNRKKKEIPVANRPETNMIKIGTATSLYPEKKKNLGKKRVTTVVKVKPDMNDGTESCDDDDMEVLTQDEFDNIEDSDEEKTEKTENNDTKLINNVEEPSNHIGIKENDKDKDNAEDNGEEAEDDEYSEGERPESIVIKCDIPKDISKSTGSYSLGNASGTKKYTIGTKPIVKMTPTSKPKNVVKTSYATSKPKNVIKTSYATSKPKNVIKTSYATSKPKNVVKTSYATSKPKNVVKTSCVTSKPKNVVKTSCVTSKPKNVVKTNIKIASGKQVYSTSKTYKTGLSQN